MASHPVPLSLTILPLIFENTSSSQVKSIDFVPNPQQVKKGHPLEICTLLDPVFISLSMSRPKFEFKDVSNIR